MSSNRAHGTEEKGEILMLYPIDGKNSKIHEKQIPFEDICTYIYM